MEQLGYTCRCESPLGGIMLASNGAALTGLWFDGQRQPQIPCPLFREERELPLFTQTKEWLDIYFSGKQPEFDLPLSPSGTPFQKEIWELLLSIPYGHTATYGDIAKHIAQRHGIPSMSPQAVGGAVGRNRISIIIPCHRVVGTGGRLTGYAGGLHRKEALLRLEGSLKA